MNIKITPYLFLLLSFYNTVNADSKLEITCTDCQKNTWICPDNTCQTAIMMKERGSYKTASFVVDGFNNEIMPNVLTYEEKTGEITSTELLDEKTGKPLVIRCSDCTKEHGVTVITFENEHLTWVNKKDCE